jgi:uncharacterized SAM-binding protein YcdF (DUF218 family)
MSDAPMLRGHDVVCLSTIDWQFIWQGHQEIMSALAANGNRVLFVENTGVRAPSIRDLPRVRQRVRNWWRGTKGFRQERENLFVYSPILLPFPYSRIAGWLNRLLLVRSLGRWMRAARFDRPVVWTFLPTPLALDVIRSLDPLVTIYYCIDDLASSSPGARRIATSEKALFAEADLVFVTSDRLRERALKSSERVHLFPFAVSYAKFDRARETPDNVPDDIARLPKPVVGYVGGLHQWIDFPLLRQAALALPDVSFVFIGPEQTDTSDLAGLPNVHLFGQRPHDDVPRYMKGFDVGIVPYRLSEYTANVYPTKLNEYLAMGLPVVTTNLAEIRRFNAEHGPTIAVAEDAGGFVAAVRQALQPVTPEVRDRRIAIARTNSWASRLAEMSTLIDGVIAGRSRDRSWEDRLRRIYRRSRGQLAAALATLVLVYVVLFQTSFAWWAAEPLQLAEPPRQADAIVVFAGGVGESGVAGGGYQERLKQALDLYRGGFAPRMIFSSGFVFSFSEAQVMRDLALANGVPAAAIELETNAANTYENVRFTREILAAHGWRRVLLVSSPYHMRRAMLTWRKAAPDIEVVASPVPYSQFYYHARGASLDQIRGLLHEYAAIVVYWWRGWI